ncbi:MAG: hypothetical protein WD851_23730 [Pirellulales bacterium]
MKLLDTVTIEKHNAPSQLDDNCPLGAGFSLISGFFWGRVLLAGLPICFPDRKRQFQKKPKKATMAAARCLQAAPASGMMEKGVVTQFVNWVCFIGGCAEGRLSKVFLRLQIEEPFSFALADS